MDYSAAANDMLKSALREKIDDLTANQRAKYTRVIERQLKLTHQKLRKNLQGTGHTPKDIAEEAYEQTREELELDKFDPIIGFGNEL